MSSFLISLDFELHWGVRDKRTVASYEDHLRGERDAIAGMLDLFVASGVRATWATVGFLFCEGRDEALAAAPDERPTYADPALDPYADLVRCGESEAADPYHFAPSVIRRIASAAGQELGTHTYSHFYCLEAGVTDAQLRADLVAAQHVAAARGVSLESIVFPRNQVSDAALRVCAEVGLRYFRGNRDAFMYRGVADDDDSWLRRGLRLVDAYVPVAGRGAAPTARGALANLEASRFLRPVSSSLGKLEPLRVRRILHEMRACAKAGRDYHLWWHPHNFGVRLADNLAVLKTVLDHHRVLAGIYGVTSRTMAEAGQLALAQSAA